MYLLTFPIQRPSSRIEFGHIDRYSGSTFGGRYGQARWILLPFHPDFRWLRERTDSPWYPTARLYRQKKDGDWTDVLERVSADLKNIAH